MDHLRYSVTRDQLVLNKSNQFSQFSHFNIPTLVFVLVFIPSSVLMCLSELAIEMAMPVANEKKNLA